MKLLFSKLIVLYLLFLSFLAASCLKNTDDGPVTPLKGSLAGSITLKDRYGNEDPDLRGTTVKLIENRKVTSSVITDAAGSFRFDSVNYGIVILKIDRPGYGIIDTLSFNHQKKNDTLSDIELLEELPFHFNLFQCWYGSQMLHSITSTVYQTTDSYMVTQFICFSRDPGVSVNHCEYSRSTSDFTNVSYLYTGTNAAVSCSIKSFLDNGFQPGDRIYTVCYPVVEAFFDQYHDQTRNFKTISWKMGNPSVTSSFILTE